MKDQESHELIQRYLNGQCTPEESALVNSWYVKRSNELAKDQLPEPDYEFWNNRISKNLPLAEKITPLWIKYSAAASILLFLGLGLFYLRTDKPIQTTIHTTRADQKIVPGKNAATLTLANGKKIILSDVTNGVVAESDGMRITKADDGQLIYKRNHRNAGANETNILTTSNGETYRIILPDGTKIWLNAASNLKYTPALIQNGNRVVELNGEGYFEVAKDKKHPFIVKTARQEVTVLGTHFNISSYADEDKTVTTLLEGSVIVRKNKEQKVLSPGQQSLLSDDIFSVKAVEVDNVIAWKNGLFLFNDESLEDIMKKISRWYDVEVVYQNSNKKELYWGGVSRYDEITKVLKRLELTRGVHFKIEGRKIIVTK